MRRWIAGIALACAVALGGVANAGWFDSGWDEGMKKANDCIDKAAADPAYAPLFAKLAVVRTATLSDLANEAYATPADGELIKAFSDACRPCRGIRMATVQKYHPYLQTGWELAYYKTDLVLLDLVQRKATYGVANQRMREIDLELMAHFDAYNKAASEEEQRNLSEQARQLRRTFEGFKPKKTTVCDEVNGTVYCHEL